ncbi:MULTISPECIES: hypothetical protein [unclassified Iodidimonas]|jgi:hypothetical protein|uniref:hypothetical protein n=1 Tax=unclassified Iodidimonas TaxID=2626145 RepID=UPI002482D19E|nr:MULTISPECIES: hypothetical protein [unclassified Iodidimonas]
MTRQITEDAFEKDQAPIEQPVLAQPVRDFLTISDHLTALLARENALLETRRPRETKALAGEKLRLTEAYKQALEDLRSKESQYLGPKDSSIRKKVKATTELFRAELARHAKLIIRLKTVSEGIVKSISDEAMKQKNPVRNYGQNGRMNTPYGAGASLSLDRQI